MSFEDIFDDFDFDASKDIDWAALETSENDAMAIDFPQRAAGQKRRVSLQGDPDAAAAAAAATAAAGGSGSSSGSVGSGSSSNSSSSSSHHGATKQMKYESFDRIAATTRATFLVDAPGRAPSISSSASSSSSSKGGWARATAAAHGEACRTASVPNAAVNSSSTIVLSNMSGKSVGSVQSDGPGGGADSQGTLNDAGVVADVHKTAAMKFLGTLNQGDMDRLALVLHDNFEDECSFEVPDLPQPVTGKVALMTYLSLMFETFPDGLYRMRQIKADPGASEVTVSYQFSGRSVFNQSLVRFPLSPCVPSLQPFL
jgi:hypothetical protein